MSHIYHLLIVLALVAIIGSTAVVAGPSFAEFDRRARKGERLTVVFFGASLTWGANATDPQRTSYRAVMAEYFEQAYPKAHFHFIDAAIGGTGSQLGVFRFDRDVLRYHPDLVFLDFSANDDIYSDNPESMASYESLLRRLIVDARVPVVQVIFPFGWNVENGKPEEMKRRLLHIELSKAYNSSVGDAIVYCKEQVKEGKATVQKIWPSDMVHPGDFGYRLFANAAWKAYQSGVKEKLVCQAPKKMRYADTYMANARVCISSLGALPEGWHVGTPNLVAAWYDGLMSRWLDDESIASNRKMVAGENGKMKPVPVTPARLQCKFNAAMVMLFGEETIKSGKYRVIIDGKPVTYLPYGGKEPIDYFDASGKRYGGNRQHAQVIVTGLDTTVDHTLEIEPLFTDKDEETELRLESICVAGGKAKVWRD